MKKRRFKNIWTIGLILVGVLLIAFYVAKIFFPEFIVGVAQNENIVKFGNYVDSHKWATHAFNVAIICFTAYFYFGGCCRTHKFGWKGLLVILVYIVGMRLASEFASKYYTHINYGCMVFIPFLICVVEKRLSKETFISTAICFIIEIMAQVLSVLSRDLTPYLYNINSATLLVLLIDVFIWRILIYLFFNFRKKEE